MMIESRVPELISGVPEPISGVPTSATPGATGQSGVLVDGFHYTSSHSHVHNGNLNSYLSLGVSIVSTVELLLPPLESYYTFTKVTQRVLYVSFLRSYRVYPWLPEPRWRRTSGTRGSSWTSPAYKPCPSPSRLLPRLPKVNPGCERLPRYACDIS